MEKCSECPKIAIWECKLFNKVLCEKHSGKHAMDCIYKNLTPNFDRIAFILSENQKNQLEKEINTRINGIKNHKINFIKRTKEIISATKQSCKDALRNLDNIIEFYKTLLSKEIYDKISKFHIDNIIKTSLSFSENNCDLINLSINQFYFKNEIKEYQIFRGNSSITELKKQFGLNIQAHTDAVLCVAISSDSNHIASGSKDRTIRVWNANERIQEFFLEGHEDDIVDIKFSFDKKYIISASKDTTICVWDFHNKKLTAVLKIHKDSVNGLALACGSKYVISISSDKTICIWDLTNFKILKSLTGFSDEFLCVDSMENNDYFLCGSCDGTLKAFDFKEYNELFVLKGHMDAVVTVSKHLRNNAAISGSKDKTIRVWDLFKRCQKNVLETKNPLIKIVTSHYYMAYSVSSNEKVVSMWNLNTNKLEKTFLEHNKTINSLAISFENNFIVTGSMDYSVGIEYFNHFNIFGLNSFNKLPGHHKAITGAKLDKVSNLVITLSNDSTVQTWDTRFKHLKKNTIGISYRIVSTILSPDCRFIISACYDKTLKVWNYHNFEYICSLEGHTKKIKCVAVANNSSFCISGSADCTLKIFDLTSLLEKGILNGHTGSVSAVNLTNDDLHAVSGSYDKTIRIWNLKKLEQTNIIENHKGPITGLALCRHRIISCSVDKTICFSSIFHYEFSDKILQTKNFYKRCISISNNGHYAAIGGTDKNVTLYYLSSGYINQEFQGHTGIVSGIAFTKNDEFLLSSSFDKTVRLWSIKSSSNDFILFTGAEKLYSIALSLDERYIIVSSDDCTVHVWDWLEKRNTIILSGIDSIKDEVNKF